MWMMLIIAMQIELAHHPDAQRLFWSLVQDAHYGFAETEEAAFVVLSQTGLALVRWPVSGRRREARWSGAHPRGTIAIVHTHPNRIPYPSTIDKRTARQRNVPVYVLTRTKITRTSGDEAQLLIDGDWKPGARPEE